MNSARLETGTLGPTTSTLGMNVTCDTGVRSLTKLYGRFLYRLILVTSVLVAMNKVYPSGADLATMSAPILPAAPGRFSTMTGSPSSGRRFSASTRAVTSVLPPGGYGTTSLIGREGQVSANAGTATCSISTAHAIALSTLFMVISS